MQTAKTKTYTPDQLANAEKMFTILSALPEDKQKTVIMVANAFMDGMKAQELFAASKAGA